MKLGGKFLTEDELRDACFCRIGKNVRIHDRASIYGTENISIGDNVRIDDFVVIIASGHLELGSYVHIANFSFVGSKHGVVFEDFVTLAPGVKIFTSSDDYSGEKLTHPMLPKKFVGGKSGRVVLKKHVIIGTGSVILPNCVIGEGCSVGALSLVNKNLEPWGIYTGIPVSRLKNRKKGVLALEDRIRKDVCYGD